MATGSKTMRLALCNEVLRPLDFAAQCALARDLGYDGVELAPFTLDDDPQRIDATRADHLRRTADEAGIAITGLHWLLVAPEGLSITSPDAGVRRRTAEFMCALVDLCAALGGRYLVHGSPAQRRVPAGSTHAEAWSRAADCFAQAGERAASRGLLYLVEPLPADETDLVNTLHEASRMVADARVRGLGLVLDTKSVALSETQSAAEVASRWVPTGMIGHVQLNDRNRRAPGQGGDRFAPLLAALLRHGYEGDLAIEPFDYVPDGPTQAARAIGYVKGVLEGLAEPSRAL
jgi:sugar phosphate isomerase/epimerase